MAKNRVKTAAKTLADIVLDARSAAYKDLCVMSTDENGFQSDQAAARLRTEITDVLKELLQGDFGSVNAKLAEHAPTVPPSMAIRPRGAKITDRGDFWSITKPIRLGNHDALLERHDAAGETPEQRVYLILLRSLEDGSIEHLAQCRNCGKIFYRKNPNKRSCGNECRWDFHNHKPERKKDRVKGVWKPKGRQ